MTTDRSADMEMRFDPEFDPIPRASKGESDRRRLRFRTRSMMLLVLVVGIWLAILIDPLLRPLAGSTLLWIVGMLVFMLAFMSLAWLGFGLFALGDWIIGWFQRSTRWPES